METNALIKTDWGEHYESWSTSRTRKLLNVLGSEWFVGKKILDVGCGHGNNGKFFISMGAKCVFTDGRTQHVDKLLSDGYEAYIMDQNNPWTIQDQFDLIIHWGVLYHLENWEQDLRCAISHSSLISLESEVCDFDDPHYEEKKPDRKARHDELDDQALNGMGTLFSPSRIENFLQQLNVSFTRYDDEDLNSVPYHCYNWESMNKGYTVGQRRFWIIRR